MMIAKSYLGIKKIKARQKLKLIKFFNVFSFVFILYLFD